MGTEKTLRMIHNEDLNNNPYLSLQTVSFQETNALELNLNLKIDGEALTDLEGIQKFRAACLEMSRICGLLQALHANRLISAALSSGPQTDDEIDALQAPYEREIESLLEQLPQQLREWSC